MTFLYRLVVAAALLVLAAAALPRACAVAGCAARAGSFQGFGRCTTHLEKPP